MKKLLLLCACLVFVSFSAIKDNACRAVYDQTISRVVTPAGNVINLSPQTKMKGSDTIYLCSYSDSIFDFSFIVYSDNITMYLRNKNLQPAVIDWNGVSYTNYLMQSKRMLPKKIPLIKRNDIYPSTAIAGNSFLAESLIPVDNIIYDSFTNSFKTQPLFPCFYKSENDYVNDSISWIGKKTNLLIPIQANGNINNYTFEFEIKRSKKVPVNAIVP